MFLFHVLKYVIEHAKVTKQLGLRIICLTLNFYYLRAFKIKGMQELKDKVSYAVGLSIAESLKSQQLGLSLIHISEPTRPY